MKKITIIALCVSFAFGFAGPIGVFAASPATVNLGTAGNFVILAKTGISTTGTTSIIGDLGISPAAASYITGFSLILPAASAFSTSALVTGKVYAPGYADPTPTNLTTAISNMETAYTEGAGRAANVTELGAGNIGGMTLAPGVYKWGTGLIIPTDITLSGGANDVWIFQVAQNLNISSATKIILSGGAQANNIFWVVAGQTTLGTTSVFNGNILDQTTIVLNTGTTLNGRALAQAAVTMDSNAVTSPTSVSATSGVSSAPTCSNLYWFDNTNATCQSQKQFCGAYMYQGLQAFNSYKDCYNAALIKQITTTLIYAPVVSSTQTQTPSSSSDVRAVLQNQLNGLMENLRSLQAQQGSAASAAASNFGQQVKAIVTSMAKGSRGANVITLQQFLISQNKGPAAQALITAGATAYFGEATRAALAEFQAKVGISPALGNFGAITRAYLNSH